MSASQRNKNKSQGRRNQMKGKSDGPPQLAIALRMGHTFRFSATAAITNRTLTFTELLDLLCMAVTTTSAYRLLASVKLKRIRIWAASSSGSAPVTVAFQPSSTVSGSFGSSVTYSDTVLGTARNAFLDVKIKDRDQVGQWHDANSNAGYGVITVPQGAVVDLTMSFTFLESSADVSAVSGSVSGATIGAVYTRYLDNSQATPQLIPVTYIAV